MADLVRNMNIKDRKLEWISFVLIGVNSSSSLATTDLLIILTQTTTIKSSAFEHDLS